MLPVIALIGSPNVGKSTLFNRLTKSRDAIVADFPGLTRDRQYGYGKIGSIPYLVIDTGGITGDEEGISELMVQQTSEAIKEADVLIVMVDGRAGPSASDQHIIEITRKHSKKIWFVVNKTEGLDLDIAVSEFQNFGFSRTTAISASHGDQVTSMMDEVLKPFIDEADPQDIESLGCDENKSLRIAIIGRPNVGKSTLINRLIGEDRLVVYDQPGTTRDTIKIDIQKNDENYTLFDTAGVRRKARVRESIEKFSVIKSMHAIEKCNVVFSVIDASEGITEQDISLMGLSIDRGRALVLLLNKWDGLDKEQKKNINNQIDRRLPFLDFADKHAISALHGTGVGNLLRAAKKAYKAATRNISTNLLTSELEDAVIEHAPPLVRGRRIRLRYAHQGGKNPPTIVVHGNQTERLPLAYKRYLMNRFRKRFKLQGTPVKLVFKTSDNPFKGRRNKLTPRQARKKKRLMKYTKKKN
jgi:GTP-binding protein